MNGMIKRKPHFSNNRNFGQNRHGGRHKNNNGGNNAMHHHAQGDDNFVHPRMRRPLQTQKDRYVALARDALSSGDRILAEYYYQYVEHFSRMINLIPVPQQNQRKPDAQGAENAEEGLQDAEATTEGDDNGADEGAEVPPSSFETGPSSYYARTPKAAAAPAAPKMDAQEDAE